MIDSALRRTAASRGGVVFVVGEAGLGKSRIARAAEAAARATDMAVLTGRAVRDGQTSAFRALSEALLRASRIAGLPDSPDLGPFRGYLARIVPEWRAAAAPITEEGDVGLAEGVLRLLRLLGGRSGCLLVLEDLHWADAGTLAVVEYLADNLDGEPVVCLVTVRTGENSRDWCGIGLAACRSWSRRFSRRSPRVGYCRRAGVTGLFGKPCRWLYR